MDNAIATSNLGKIKELSDLLAPTECIPQTHLGIYDLIENALIKALHASLLADQHALADDSGLVVPALNGEPAIYSAHYAGAHATDANNIQLLLEKMRNLPQEQRGAWFY